MIRALFLSVALAALPAHAALAQTQTPGQTPPPAPPAPAAPAAPAEPAEEAQSPEEAAFEARGEAFGEQIRAMAEEMQKAIQEAGSVAAAKPRLDQIQAQYQPVADGFADDLVKFLNDQAVNVPEDQRAGMQTAAQTAAPQIKGVPAMVRAQIEQSSTAPAPAAPAAPSTPPSNR